MTTLKPGQVLTGDSVKPCPFCGSKMVIPLDYKMWCEACHAYGPPELSGPEGKLKTWNTRFPLSTKLQGEDQGSSAAPIPTEQADTDVVDERDAFERWYCEDAAEIGIKCLPIEILALRGGDSYGAQRVALNSKWEGWKARAAIAKGGAA